MDAGAAAQAVKDDANRRLLEAILLELQRMNALLAHNMEPSSAEVPGYEVK